MFKEVEDAWTQDSGGYDELIKKQLKKKAAVEHWSQELKKVLGEKPLKILEVGCGPGFLSIIMTRLGHEVKAIDGSSGMVRCAAGNFAAEGRDIPVEEEDAVELSKEEAESYDVIISRDVVWTLYDPEKAFVRWKEVLKPEGRIIIYDGNYRRDQDSWQRTAWMLLSKIVQAVSEKKLPRKSAHHAGTGVFEALPMVTQERPEKDMELLRKAGYKRVRISNDKFRNSPKHLDFWKYGYQGKKFRIIAWKSTQR